MEELITIGEAKQDILSCAIYLAGNINSTESQAEALRLIVSHYLNNNDVDNAAQYADVIQDSFTRNQMLVGVISKCVEIDDDEYAFQLVDSIDDHGAKVRAREAIGLNLAAKGKFDQALEIAESLEHSSDLLAGIAVNQAKKGFETEANGTLERIDFFKSTVGALQEIAVHFIKEENLEKASEYLERAFVFSEDIEFTEDRIRAYFENGAYFNEVERQDRAIESFTKASNEIEQLEGIQKDNLFGTVAVGFLNAGSVDLADRNLDAVTDKTQMSSCLVGFSQVFEKDGDREEALETLEESYAILKSEQESEIRDSKVRYQLFATIAIQFANLEKIERSLEIAHENPVEFQRNFALTNIAQVCILQGNDEMADQALKGIEADSQRLAALVAMSDAKKQADKSNEAIEMLNEATTLIDSIPQFIARTDTQNEIANRLGFYSKADEARKIASDSLQTIGEVLGDNNRSIALTELAKIYEKYDFTPTAEDKEILELLVRKSDW